MGDSFMFAFNATMPIVFTVIVGYALKALGLMSKDFAAKANRLVFRLFLPATLFLNVYGIEDLAGVNFGYAAYSAVIIAIVFAIGIPIVMLVTRDGRRRGPLLQSFFRSNNALIGVPLAESLFGAAGALVASILSALIIPLFNVLSVVSLSLFHTAPADSEGENEQKAPPRVIFYIKKILHAIVTNPLIISIAIGFVTLGIRAILVSFNVEWRLSDITVLFSVLKYLSSIATPLALLALGAQFEFSVISELKREIIAGTLARTLIVPVISIGVACLAFAKSFTGAEFAAMLALFCTPVAVSSVPMTQEMDADVPLAGQLVIFTTVFSSLTIFIASFVLKEIGIF